MQKGFVKPAHMTMRYKVMKTNYKFYLIDTDYSFWWILFPFLSWFYAVPTYEISKETAMELTQKSKNVKMSTILIYSGIGAIIGVLLKPLSHYLEYLTIHVSTKVNLISLLVGLLLIIIVRLGVSKSKKVDVSSIAIDKTYFKIKPGTASSYLKTFYVAVTLILVAIGCLSIYVFVVQNLYFLAFGMFIVFIYTIISSVYMRFDLVKVQEIPRDKYDNVGTI